MPDGMTEGPEKVYALRVFDKTVRQYRTREGALAALADLEEAPKLFIEIDEWTPEAWMLPYVHFRDDEVKGG